MILKLYGLVWLVGIAAVAAAYLLGYFTPTVAVTFGFLSFGAIFMGMIGVLPMTVGHHEQPKH